MKKMFVLSMVIMAVSILFAGSGLAQAPESARGYDEGPWPVYAITYGRGIILTSPDSETWTVRSSGTDVPLAALAYGNERFVAVGAYGTIVTSPDSLNWTTVRSGSQSWLAAAVRARKKFVVVGTDGTILTSPDGTSWSPKL
jgi:photosystem II stability/assembly factor-like uncharacterized protein